ncbi:MAG: ZIP family metal transporter [Ruminococcus sp.]|nr:ZIP family metal transporter [Ruminococcus sp.]
MSKITGLILTIIVGLFFPIGGLISSKVKNKSKLNNFSIAIAFIIMLSLIFLDLGPESYDLLIGRYSVFRALSIVIISALIGFFILRLLDLFIPHHDHHDKNVKEHNNHIKHISTLTIISLTLHNIIEGFAICGLGNNNLKVGILTCLSVALHNIPLGTQIFSSLKFKDNKVSFIILVISSLIGGLIFTFVGNVNNVLLAIITGIALGMLLFIALIELLPELLDNLKQKETKIGLLVGVILIIISAFI